MSCVDLGLEHKLPSQAQVQTWRYVCCWLGSNSCVPMSLVLSFRTVIGTGEGDSPVILDMSELLDIKLSLCVDCVWRNQIVLFSMSRMNLEKWLKLSS